MWVKRVCHELMTHPFWLVFILFSVAECRGFGKLYHDCGIKMLCDMVFWNQKLTKNFVML